MSDQKPPPGLRAPGRALWESVLSKYLLTPAELAMLGTAAQTLDELARLERALRGSPDLTVPGSTGQPVRHPLLAEARAHRRTFQNLLAALALPDDGQQIGDRPATQRAQKAAAARWQQSRDGA